MAIVVNTDEVLPQKIINMIQDSEEGPDFFSRFNQAKNIIGIDNAIVENINYIIIAFLTKYTEEIEENKLLELKNSRDLLIQTNILAQIHSTGQFKPWQKPFRDACPKCNGTGQLYYFNRMSKEVVCNRCIKGQIWMDCPKCKGKGRIIVRYKKGGGTDSICHECDESTEAYREKFKEPNSKFKIQAMCRVCKGTTNAKILVLDYSLKSTTACSLCDSLGIIIPVRKSKKTPKKTSVLRNPVIASDLAVKINLLIDERKHFKAGVSNEQDESE